MSWRDEWRRKAHGWIQRLNRLALDWHQLDLQGVTVARERRRQALRVRDWMYEVIDVYLGGIERLPNRMPAKTKGGRKTKGGELGAINLALVLAGTAVTVATIGAWISNEEQRVIEAKTKLVRAIGEEARQATDPEVKRALAGVANRLDPNPPKSGPSLMWLLPLAAAPFVPAAIKRLRGRGRAAA